MKRLTGVLRQLPSLVERGAFDALCDRIRREIPIDLLGLARVAPGGDHIRRYMLWTSDEVGVPRGAWAERVDVTREQLEMAYLGAYRLCRDTLASSSPIERSTGEAGVRCTLSVPLGRPLDAIVGFGFRSPDRLRDEHLPLLRALARALHDHLDYSLMEAHADRLRLIFDAMPMGALLLNRDGTVDEVNAATARLVGCDKSELLGRSIRELITALDGGLLGWRIDRANGPALALLHTKNGPRVVEVQLASAPQIRSRPGRFGPLFVVERAGDAARALADLEERHRALVDNLPVVVYSCDAEQRCTHVSGAVERILGYTPEEIYAMRDWTVLNVDDPQPGTDPGHDERDVRQRRKDGREIVMRYRVRRIVDETGRVVRTEGFGVDVTAEREAQRRLLLADRLAALGMLVAGIGHEINNPAAYVTLGVQQMRRHLQRARNEPGARVQPLVDTLLPIVEDVMTGIQRIAGIVGELKLFARNPTAQGGPVDLNALVRSAATLVQAELRARARLTFDLGELPAVPAEWARLSQVLLNLLVNAAQSIEPGNAAAHEVLVQSRFVDGEVRLVVRDTGCGMDAEMQRRIFTPFFSTKPVGEGTGLGLAVSYDIARRLGGRITVTSEPGEGSEFIVAVPFVSPADARDRGLEQGGAPEAATRASVLVIDDERPLAAAVGRELSLRLRVQLAHSGADALAALAQARYDAVLCDVRMPDLSGIDVYMRTRARDTVQAERFVFMTGAGAAAGEAEFLREAGRPLLEKPFEMGELWRTVGEIVDHA